MTDKHQDENLRQYRKDYCFLNKMLGEINNNAIQTRLAHELYTYAGRARFYKYCYNISQVSILLIPLLIILCQSMGWDAIMISVLSAMITAISGISNALAFQNKWQHYRYYCETAKQELSMYLSKSGEYGAVADDEERERMFVERIENIFNDEKENWRIIVKNKQKEEETSKTP